MLAEILLIFIAGIFLGIVLERKFIKGGIFEEEDE